MLPKKSTVSVDADDHGQALTEAYGNFDRLVACGWLLGDVKLGRFIEKADALRIGRKAGKLAPGLKAEFDAPSRRLGKRRQAPSDVGPTVVIFNVTYAHFCTNKPDSAPFRIAKTNALHPRTQHFNISPPAGPRWWHTPRSQRRQSSTRSQRATSGRARTARIGTIRHATQRPSQRSARLARAPRARNAATS